MFYIMLSGLIFLLLVIFSGETSGEGLIVNIEDGALAGLKAITTNNNIQFWAFLGIPYAAPPIGDLRFRPPQPVEPWSGVRDATYHRSVCMQYDMTPPETSEDCLFVNVYTPVQPGTNASLPVMVLIHGGGFVVGSGNIGIHGADFLIEHDVIVVSMNYRLNVFGFLSTSDAASPGNYGLKDQIAALEWVQKNIANFGGNPDKVTIFGHSAGSVSILYLMQSRLAKGLFHAAIAQSGSSLNPWGVTSDPRYFAFEAGIYNFIFTYNSTELVEQLRKIDAKHLIKSATRRSKNFRDSKNGLPWGPCLENNVFGAAVTSYSHELLSNGKFSRVPLMTGFASLETRDTNRLKWLVALYSVEFALFPSTMVPYDTNAVDRSAAGEEIKRFYFNDIPIGNNTNYVKYGSDNFFVRGINKHVDLMKPYIPVYYYRFAFTGGVDHAKFYPEGASHGEELQFLFDMNGIKQNTPEAILTQKRMVKMWTNFAKYHNPTPQADPDLSNLTWNVTDANNNGKLIYLNIDTDLSIEEDPEREHMQFWDDLYNKYGFQPYNTY